MNALQTFKLQKKKLCYIKSTLHKSENQSLTTHLLAEVQTDKVSLQVIQTFLELHSKKTLLNK